MGKRGPKVKESRNASLAKYAAAHPNVTYESLGRIFKISKQWAFVLAQRAKDGEKPANEIK